MRNADRRLAALESKSGISDDFVEIIFINAVASSADGPEHLGPIRAYILTGPHKGTQQVRVDGESAEAFEARCHRLIGVAA
jgi:hypothetical protein